MKTIVLTGGIAAGKSAAAEILAGAGAEIIDADVIAREVTSAGGACSDALRKAFPECFDNTGILDRRRMREAVFNDGEKLRLLNSITHPAVFAEIANRLKAFSENKIARGRGLKEQAGEVRLKEALAVVVVPLYFESGYKIDGAEVWNIEAPDSHRIERLCKRDNISGELAAKMLAAQNSNAERRAKSGFTAVNDAKPEDLERAILKALSARAFL